jgi:hypothetical protein
MALEWTATYWRNKRDANYAAVGDRADVIAAVEAKARREGLRAEVDGFTDQVDAFTVGRDGRRRRWLILMP